MPTQPESPTLTGERTVAIVGLVKEGDHGRYAVCYPEGKNEIVTFSLREDVWAEDSEPEPGTKVKIWGIFRKRAGLRARHACYEV